MPGKREATANWEEMGGASGLLATVMFVLGFLTFLSLNPTGDVPVPNLETAQEAPAFIAGDLTGFRLSTLFTTLGIVLFLWFLGSLWSSIRGAEGSTGRGALLVVVGASVGAALMLLANVLRFTAGAATSPVQAESVPTLYAASAVAFAFGGGCLSLFFFAAGKVVLRTGVLPRWLGWLAMVSGVLAALAFMTPFFDSGLLDPATGLLGLWAWWIAFVLWVFLASLVVTMEERRRVRASVADASPMPRPVPATNESGGAI